MAKQENLLKMLRDIAKKEDYGLANIDLKPINSGGANYTTDLYLATLSDVGKSDINLFVKVSNLSEKARENNNFLRNVYVTESLFYTELVNHFERIYKKHNVPVQDRLAIPKYYEHSLNPYEETLVLENLEAGGYENFDRMTVFDWEYAAEAVTQLARFHAIGVAFKDESPEEFEKLVSRFKNGFMDDAEMMHEMMKQTIDNVCGVLSEVHKNRLLNYVKTINPIEVFDKAMEDTTLLIHADFKPSNIMHKRRNGKLELMLLDYQLMRMGNPVYDLMIFLFSGSDAEFRRLYYQRLMDHYYSELAAALNNLKIDVEKVYPRKTFDNDLIESRPYSLLLSLLLVGVVTVAPEDAPTFDGDISSMKIKLSQAAQDRLTGIVEDFINWGLL